MIALLVFAFLPACTSEPIAVGGRRDVATAWLGTYRVVLSDLPVLTAAAALEEALLARGYTVVRAESTQDRTVIVGRTGAEWWTEKFVGTITVAPEGAAVSLRREPAADETATLAILDDMLKRLGR